jgi:KUP system potassium uptake protein
MKSGDQQSFGRVLLSAISCMGVIWGDIGTSPLYTYSAIYNCEETCQTPSESDAKETLSTVFYTLTLVTFIKYIVILLRMDYHGEGGIFALLLNVTRKPRRKLPKAWARIFLALAAVGASAVMADGFLTPALSVLSAVEGLKSTKIMSSDQIDTISSLVVPVTCVILVLLFFMQRHGSTKVGRVFGPIMLVYFSCLASIGIYNLVDTGNFEILEALSPVYAFRFFFSGRFSGYESFKKLSSIILCVTGAEALYADLGHYTKLPIYISWCLVVYPSLILTYAGQAAALTRDPTIVGSAFWASVPSTFYIPMLIIATLATVVASQAMISGCFSLISQAVTLSLFPRVRVVNTDPSRAGQIYIPEINLILAIGTILLVLVFQSSTALAGAYGISVVLTFNITTLLLGAVLYSCKWPNTKWYFVLLALSPMLAIDMLFLVSNITFKFVHGGWITITFTIVISSVMLCWLYGRKATQAARSSEISSGSQSMRHLTTFDALAAAVNSGTVKRGHGIGVFLSPSKLKVGRRLNLSSIVDATKIEQGITTTPSDEINRTQSKLDRMISNISGVVPVSGCALPSALELYLRVTGSIQRVVILLHVEFDQDRPVLNINDRVELEEVVTGSAIGIYSATVTFGFAELKVGEIDMGKILKQWVLEQIPRHRSLADLFEPSLPGEDDQLWYFLHKEDHIAKPGSSIFRKAIIFMYSALHTVSRSAYAFFNLPVNECIQLGGCVAI